MKPKSNRERKTKEVDKDTVVAYHEFIQGRIQGELNGLSIGPGRFLFKLAGILALFGMACLLVGILVITLRHRHVYLVDWNHQFVGPFFLILFLMCFAFATFLLLIAKRRTNQYRADLAFRPIGDYGVAVVHKSKLHYDEQKKTELKSGTTPHNVRHPGRPGVNEKSNRGDYSKSRGYDNRGYKDEYDNGRRDYDRDRRDRDRRDYDRDRRDRDRDGRGRDERDGRRRDDRPPREGDRRRPDGDRGRRPDDRDRRRDDRDRPRGPPPDRDRRRPPPGPEDEKRREEARRRYEDEKRRRYEEDKRRAALRKQAEAESYDRPPRGEERGVDVDPGTRQYQVHTTVTLSRPTQGTDESEL